MPLVANTSLPAFNRLRQEGETVLDPDRAQHQDIREIHIGILNMMPDAALEATERQFLRIIGESNLIAQFYVHPFTLAELPRGDKARAHIDSYYETFDSVKKEGLDALIITGANVTQPELDKEPFWEPLIKVIDWAYENVPSTLCSCLATHAVMQFRYNQKRQRLPQKCWGVFAHEVVDRIHPLTKDVNTRFDVPHSRFNAVTRQQFEDAGLHVLVESPIAGVHLAVSEDLFRIIYLQGHPEYDINSLLKEYKREVNLYIAGKRQDYPPFPENYFSIQVQAILREFQDQVINALSAGNPAPEFPETLITERLHNTWHDTGEAIINNWVGHIYQITNSDRSKCFMDGINPDDPLGLRDRYY
jgi:homoserine O-succinyltransferase